jgi:predicted nucleic acid-binding protein
MKVLVDANILLRLDHVSHPHRTIAQFAIERLFDDQHQLRTVPQVLYEYWGVATRPTTANGLGFSVADAKRMIDDHKELFPPLRDERGILEHREDLITRHEVQGKVAHDARIAAAIMRHGMTHILTLNGSDFARFKEVVAVAPESVVAGTATL